ncbi:MAG TPA: N-acetyltransferase [Candidatus Bipolaricaulis sp.]|nr:N-acetyltransferase [Candidatus Bipolaricaulis sp.]HPD07016.1 N-acetyltransferase [Candidatus Bipolaricaulis sp.]HRS13942.1 N-acetyltransferase [Candidatus Bipolaricaulis sp.]HRU21350.1 N-acetyltransferase [Candidatus Bipolaricaulis sp.]
MQVRPARPTDLPAIAAIEVRSFPDPWPEALLAGYFDDRQALILLAEEEEPLGFLIARVESPPRGGRTLHIHDLAVDPPHRRRGVGSALLAALTQAALREHISRLQLEVRVGNEAGLRFYERHGFRVTRRLAHYYEDRGAALRMERLLTPPASPSS